MANEAQISLGTAVEVSGEIAGHGDCCCADVSGECCGTSCSRMPRYFDITFSGVDDCGTCSAGACYDSDCPSCSDWLNASFTVEWYPDLCSWRWCDSCNPEGCSEVVKMVHMTIYASTIVIAAGYIIGGPCATDSELSTYCYRDMYTIPSTSDCDKCGDLPLTRTDTRLSPCIYSGTCSSGGVSTWRLRGKEGTAVLSQA